MSRRRECAPRVDQFKTAAGNEIGHCAHQIRRGGPILIAGDAECGNSDTLGRFGQIRISDRRANACVTIGRLPQQHVAVTTIGGVVGTAIGRGEPALHDRFENRGNAALHHGRDARVPHIGRADLVRRIGENQC